MATTCQTNLVSPGRTKVTNCLSACSCQPLFPHHTSTASAKIASALNFNPESPSLAISQTLPDPLRHPSTTSPIVHCDQLELLQSPKYPLHTVQTTSLSTYTLPAP